MAKTTAAVITPNALARTLSASLKRDVTAKMVRSAARDRIARFDKVEHPEYQAHVYNAAEVKVLTALFSARAGRSNAQTTGRNVSKVTTKPRAARKVTTPAPRKVKTPATPAPTDA